MSIIVDKHFYSDLFEEKKVNCHKKAYLLLFNKIWPSIENFKTFLKSSDTSLKMEASKKIYEDFAFIGNLFIPPFAVKNVLRDQTYDLKKGILNYIPQDHIIHSINLYIFGIYTFFNSDILSRKILIKDTQASYYNKIRNFVLQWQVFSLYHDVGYYIEVENAKALFSKDLKSYEQLTQQIIHSSIIKHITKSLTYKALEEKSASLLEEDVLKGVWYSGDGNILEAYPLNQKLEEYVGLLGIDGISTDEEFMAILPLLDGREYLTAVYNEYEECIALIFRNGLTVVEYLSRFQLPRDELFVNDIIDSSKEKFKFKYFVRDIKKTEFWEKAIDETVAIKDVCSQFPSDLNEFVSLHFDDIESILFQINRWLISSIPFISIPLSNTEKAQYEQHLKICYKRSIVQNLSSLIQGAIMDEKAEPGTDVKLQVIKKIINDYRKDNREELKKKIENDAIAMYEQQYGSSYPFSSYYKGLRKSIAEQSFISQDTLLEFVDTKNKRINYLKFDGENESHKKLYKLLADLAEDLGLTLEEILSYKTPYADYDHGIISACMLFQAALSIHDLKKYCMSENLLSLAWDGPYESEEDFLRFCAESIFAVMIHNVYNKKSRPEYGLSYSHDLDKNPFAYFCAFCDTIQRWGRPKLIDLSQTALPPNNLLEDEIDVRISEGSIYIQCLENNIDGIRKMIQESNSYLPGISQLVKVSRI